MNKHFFNFPLFPASHELFTEEKLSEATSRQVLVFLAWETAEDELKPFLAKVLAAAKLDIEKDVFIINKTPEIRLSFPRMLNEYAFEHILLFGIPPKSLGLHFNLSPYQAIDFRGKKYLLADSISDIYNERQTGGKEKSAALWSCLKTLFVESS